MSTRGIEFANNWVQQNVDLEPYNPGRKTIEDAVKRLLADARAEGITREDIEDDTGDLQDFISAAYEKRTDEEVDRLAAKDR